MPGILLLLFGHVNWNYPTSCANRSTASWWWNRPGTNIYTGSWINQITEIKNKIFRT